MSGLADVILTRGRPANSHGFLLSKGEFTAIDVPAAFGIQTGASGINPQGDIVGTYSDGSGQTRGFLLSRE
jgi:hypothetical protein